AYSDSAGNEQDNIKMTKQRAEAVAAVFLSAGIKASRLNTEGLGSSNPIASNKTPAGRAQNRRVEIY
ncbi:MAG TPA: OmpA family protein, partial [Arenimonas sp.]|nr:OmpA family protein [Arenimonas sp.]